MIQLFMRPQVGRQSTTRRFFSTLSAAVRSVVAPGSLLERPAAPVAIPEPAGLFEADELPAIEDIEQAAAEYDRASDQARRADRGKRAAKKVLDKVPSGVHGTWRIFRAPSSRMTPDLAAITATYKALGLGPVPMKPCASSLKVERVSVDEPAELVAS